MPRPEPPAIGLAAKHVDHETVNQLMDLLSRAQSGELIGIAWAALADAGGVAVGYAGAAKDHLYTTIGAVSSLQQDLLERIER